MREWVPRVPCDALVAGVGRGEVRVIVEEKEGERVLEGVLEGVLETGVVGVVVEGKGMDGVRAAPAWWFCQRGGGGDGGVCG